MNGRYVRLFSLPSPPFLTSIINKEEDRARKRVKLLLPQENRSPSPPCLSHLQSPSPPLVSPYPPPITQHLNYSSFVMDKSVTHSFRSSLLDELEQATNNLIEGEATMRKAMGRMWQVIAEDSDKNTGEAVDPVVPLKREEEDEDEGVDREDDRERRYTSAPDLTPSMHKLFLSQLGPPAAFEPSQFVTPEAQLDRLEKSVAIIRELQDDGREYVERLEEIREGLGDVRAQRNVIWEMVREHAVKELQDAAFAVDFDDAPPGSERYFEKLKNYAKSLPYSIESNSRVQALLDFIVLRLVQCVESKDYDPGVLQWDILFTYWTKLKYPIPKDKRIRLAVLYFELCTTPGMPINVIAACADSFVVLTRSRKKLSIDDLRLPWKPIYSILKQDLFLTRREFEYNQLSWCMGYLADAASRFFHPAALEEMLGTFVPQVNGTNLDTILASQYYMVTFLPLSHPMTYLPMLFRIWESVNSYKYDNRMLELLASLAEMHVVPSVSDPKRIGAIPDDAKTEGEGRPIWERESSSAGAWPGLFKDAYGVGIFTEHQWHLIMCKCLASMEIPLADAGSLTTGPSADNQASFEIGRLPKPAWRISSLARIIVYSMVPDSTPNPSSNAPTPMFTPLPSGMSTPTLAREGGAGDYLSTALMKAGHFKSQTYLAGSKALDSLAKMIASTEAFFHPSNSGSWTSDLTAFIKYIAYDFNRRWHEEEQPDCKTPKNRRLTKLMRRELVKSLRTCALLAMFSQDSTTAANIQSCLKSLSLMEPDLILHPILDRAIPSLESLVETERTLSVIKALGAVAPTIVSRDVYYPGAKHLIQVLQLLVPGIDLNDPSKTLCTTAFIVEISQYIMIGDLSSAPDASMTHADIVPLGSVGRVDSTPFFSAGDFEAREYGVEPRLSNKEEDALLKDTTGSFADWVTSLIRRVIQLLENLPEEGAHGDAGGASEVKLVDAVAGACSQICVHLSKPLFDLALNIIFEYATTTVRPNAVRAIHQLVECVANADPVKTLERFVPFCLQNIRTELEHGASSLRTTAASSPSPSDATLHWNLAILRGTVLKYKEEFISLFKLLMNKTYSKRGFSWAGKLLSSLLLTLSHTYPLDNKFVNPDEWDSEDFRAHHYKYWGKLYKPEEIKIAWHVPNDAEIEFILQIFQVIVEPTLQLLYGLLDPDVPRDSIWRNDFCRYLTFVRNAFSGIPTFVKYHTTAEEWRSAGKNSDILNEMAEMIAVADPLASGFCLDDPNDPRHEYVVNLRRRYGEFLHEASMSLLQQGEEYTVDAVHMLIRSIRTYMLEYGDSRDGFFVNGKQYTSEMNVARQYAKQKQWPRAVFIRRARYYNAARLRWNSMERLRGPIENSLIDDVVEWSMWHYATSRCQFPLFHETYDGTRRRVLPALYKALEPGVEDDRMKGALWTFRSTALTKYTITQPTLATDLITRLFRCQDNEKTSIQDCVSSVFDTCLNNYVEPCYLVYTIENTRVNDAARNLRALLSSDSGDSQLVERCREQRSERLRLWDNANNLTSLSVLDIAKNTRTQWRYVIVAIRILRALVRRDAPLSAPLIQFMLEKTYSSYTNVVCALFKRNSRDTCSFSPTAIPIHHNPLKVNVPVEPSHSLLAKVLQDYKTPVGKIVVRKPSSTFQPWQETSQSAVQCVRKIVTEEHFWKELSTHYAEENHRTSVSQDNMSFVKTIFQLLDDEPFESLRPTLEKLLEDQDQDSQRAGAEFLGGVLNGSKHWPTDAQAKLWNWFTPLIQRTLSQNVKTDTITIWTSFLEYIFYNHDPRRIQPLVDFLFNQFHTVEFSGESSFATVKVLDLFQAMYEGLDWKFSAWSDEVVDRYWPQIYSEHDEVREHVGDFLAFSGKIKWQPQPSIPSAEIFVRECLTVSVDVDIMGMRGTYHKDRVSRLVENFKVWRAERIPGVRAFQSTYDRVGIATCKWLFQLVHDTKAVAVFDYVLPLMVSAFYCSKTSMNDNLELAKRASFLLVRMCGVTPPHSMVDPILDGMFEAIEESPSWRVRLKALPLVQVYYFRQLPQLSDLKIVHIVEERFIKLAKRSHIPSRLSPDYNRAIRQRHAAILGICALVDSYPYTVEKWMPGLMTTVLAEHTYDPIPISTTVRKCASNFRRTHQDTWHEDSKKFNDHQLAALSTLLTGSSYCG
ncbi:hypothetical protein FIBSPDRAFT_907345 [Athelia psychrophila]|uniref:ARM repeat-containing protein n=1 Tax=Athelia psychrophila TaxID=1759441 RepID=A0A166V1E4_9AGAM|nr:hypothetical protein FIBSPDRAFT_907345 [Fibularhizoctonia sp. CBS 109695]